MPSGTIYAAESWTDRWRFADGDPLSNGWTNSGSQNAATASTTLDGVSCYSITPSVTSGSSYIQKAFTAATGSWELYARIGLPVSATGGTQRLCISYSPDGTASGSKRIELGISATGLLLFDGTNMTSRATIPDLTTPKLMDLLIQATQVTNGAANTWLRIYIGRVMVYNALAPTLGATAGAGAGTLYIGRISASAQTTPIYIADVALKTAWNDAPADYRFRSQAWPL